MKDKLTADVFVARLQALQSDDELEKIQRYFKSGKGEYGEGDQFMGVRMGQLFDLAKEFVSMDPDEIEKLLESPIHEVRAGAMSIMDKQSRQKKLPESRRKELFDLYLRRHDRINNWDLVDLAAQFVIGQYLHDKPRSVLYNLASSTYIWERRTAIVATAYFIRQGEVDETFKVAEMLIDDEQDLIHKAVGGWIREAGKKDRAKLMAFLDKYAATMPRTMLLYALEHFDEPERKHYMSLTGSS